MNSVRLSNKVTAVSYNYIIFYIPLPEILILSESFRKPLNGLQLGHPTEFYDWIMTPPKSMTHRKHSFPLFIKHIGNLRFNNQYTPLKYRQQYKEYSYLHNRTIHPPFPFYAYTLHNKLLNEFKTKFPLINPVIKAEYFFSGYITIIFSFITPKIPLGEHLVQLKHNFLKFIKEIKISIINALFPKKLTSSIFSRVLPSSGYIIHLLGGEQTSLKAYSLSNSWRPLGKFSFGRFQLFSHSENRFLVYSTKISRILRYDILLPLKWVTAHTTIFDSFTKKIIEWLQNPDLNLTQYESLWFAAAHSLNPMIHFPTFEGTSPFLLRSFQKKLFRKIARLSQLDKRYNNFIRSLKHQGLTFAPLAHHSLIDLETRGLLDPRLKLLVGIRSNIRRIPTRKVLDLSETEIQILNILLTTYEEDFRKIQYGVKIGTEDMGWMVLKQLGNALGWSDHKIYSSDKFNLRKILLILFEKGLVKTRSTSRERILYCCVNPSHEYIRTRIGKMIHHVTLK